MLVQFFIAVVDDKLLKAVGRQVLEAINVQQAEHSPFAVLFHLQKKKTDKVFNIMIFSLVNNLTHFDTLVDAIDEPRK